MIRSQFIKEYFKNTVKKYDREEKKESSKSDNREHNLVKHKATVNIIISITYINKTFVMVNIKLIIPNN